MRNDTCKHQLNEFYFKLHQQILGDSIALAGDCVPKLMTTDKEEALTPSIEIVGGTGMLKHVVVKTPAFAQRPLMVGC